jgi:hypothetical protein
MDFRGAEVNIAIDRDPLMMPLIGYCHITLLAMYFSYLLVTVLQY